MSENSATATDVEVTDLDALEETTHAEVFETTPPRTVRLSLDAGDSVPAHQHPESHVVIYVRTGALELTLGDDVHDLEAGDAIRFDGAQDVSPLAVDDADALVFFAPKAGD
ncbi:cupin domain-containing protein [Halobacterium bonnevillei]|nr:cupin domain-containing protein [Halobacterium bonnevillei]